MSERRGCLKKGCLGCLALLGVALLIVVVMLVLGILTRGGDARIEEIDREQPLPVVAFPPQAEPGRDASIALPQIPAGADAKQVGRIEIDFNLGEFDVVVGEVGSPLRLDGVYDAGRFKLEQSHTELEDGSWVYRLAVDRKGIGFLFIDTDDADNRLTLSIPRGSPIELVGSIGVGKSNLELGGLWLVDLDLEYGIGEHRLGFSEPTAAPIPRVRLDSSTGLLSVNRLGNGSPQSVEITHSIGETEIDLEGDWRGDADLQIRCGIGACRVDTPDDTGLKFGEVGVMLGDFVETPEREAEPGRPTLTLSVSATLGELRIR